MNETGLLDGYTFEEKQAYIGIIASVATADRIATEDELDYLSALAEAADIDPRIAVDSAKDNLNLRLAEYLDILKGSDLRFALITDIISFAKSDGKYTPEEQEKISNISQYLGISHQQSEALTSVVDKSNIEVTSFEEATDKSYLEKTGIAGMLKNANIPINSIVKGLIGLAAPFVLSKMMRGRSQSGNTRMGGLGGGLGGSLLGSLLGGRAGGLGSILGNLSGGRGYGGLGSILSRALQQKQR